MTFSARLRAGLIGGLVAGVTSWIYELIVWVRLLHLTSAYGIAENTAVLALVPQSAVLAPGLSRSALASIS